MWAGATALDCVPKYFDPVRPDPVPHSVQDERTNRNRARDFAAACGKKYPDLLPYMDTVSAAKDLDVIRAATGSRQLNYLGYSYGTYLGAVYAKLFPDRVRRLVLDSNVDPDGVWYDDNIAQDYAFDTRHKAFAAWVAKYDSTYGLGTDPAKVEAAWYRMRDAVKKHPAGKKVGAGELDDTFLPGGYYNGYWPTLAGAFAAYVNHKDEKALVKAYERFGAVDAEGDNGYSVYSAVQCRDAQWPSDWNVWRSDSQRVHAKAPFMTWGNTWYNAPCADWPVEPLNPVRVSNHELPLGAALPGDGRRGHSVRGRGHPSPQAQGFQPGRRGGRRQPRRHAERERLPGPVSGGLSRQGDGAARQGRRCGRGLREDARSEAGDGQVRAARVPYGGGRPGQHAARDPRVPGLTGPR